jgi:hypothetical protein
VFSCSEVALSEGCEEVDCKGDADDVGCCIVDLYEDIGGLLRVHGSGTGSVVSMRGSLRTEDWSLRKMYGRLDVAMLVTLCCSGSGSNAWYK